MSVWKTTKETPEEGSKIEYILDPTHVEVNTWINGELFFTPEDWENVKYWRYLRKGPLNGETMHSGN